MRASRPGESALLLLDAIEVLDGARVDYAVIGALAASVHGAIRASMDADVLLLAGMRVAGDLERSFAAAGYDAELTQGDQADPIPGLLRIRDAFENRVDLLIGLRGMDPAAFARGIVVPFRGAHLNFIGREDFIAMKVFAGGPLDLLDAARALSAGGTSVDLSLVRRLAGGFGKDAERALERLLADASGI